MSKKPRRDELRAIAKKLWFEKPTQSFRELEKVLAEQGHKVDHSTISRWAGEDPEWKAAALQAKLFFGTKDLLLALEEAKEDAKALSFESLVGVKVQLIARLYTTVKTMPIQTVDEWMKALDACDRIEALIHAERGKAIAEGDRLAVPRGVAPGIMDRINPNVTVAPFKKVASNGGSNGANGGGH